MTERGLFVIKDKFFSDFPDPRMMANKGGRPFYYFVKDKNGLMWMVPISSKVEKYKAIIAREEARRGVGSCVLCHVGPLFGGERAFCISNMFPITPKYVEKEFTVDGRPYVVKNDSLAGEVMSKAMRYLQLAKLGKLRPMVDIKKIESALLRDL